ncbi:hypothetical protein ACFLZU_03750 [Thermodesulfobacteriota bacterium]
MKDKPIERGIKVMLGMIRKKIQKSRAETDYYKYMSTFPNQEQAHRMGKMAGIVAVLRWKLEERASVKEFIKIYEKDNNMFPTIETDELLEQMVDIIYDDAPNVLKVVVDETAFGFRCAERYMRAFEEAYD